METDMQYITPYLPYDVRYAFRCAVDAKNDKEGVLKAGGMFDDDSLYKVLNHNEYFLMLRPLSELDKEVSYKGKEKTFWGHIFDECENYPDNYDHIGKCLKNGWIMSLPYWVIQLLLEWHFDIFDLIEQQKAIKIEKI